MFGAVGDGVTDDILAIQEAADYAMLNKVKLLLINNYVISAPIVINKFIEIIGKDINVYIMTNNSDLDCFILLNEVAPGPTGMHIRIENITFSSSNATHAYGIKINSSYIIYNTIRNIKFRYFKNACIYLLSSSQTQNPYSVYSHNLIWEHLYCFYCSSIIGQNLINETDWHNYPYIYGAILNDIHLEGDSPADYDSNPYVMNLQGFYNATLSNIILEGTLLTPRTALIYFNRDCNINSMYFEVLNGISGNQTHVTNTFIINPEYYASFNFKQMYGAIPAPLLLSKCEVYWETANLLTMPPASLKDIIDSNSSKYNLYLNEGYFPSTGTVFDIIPTDINYKKVFVNTNVRYLFDDNPPLYNVDTTKIKIGLDTAGDYQGKIWIRDLSNGEITTSTINDPFYGESLVLTSTGNTNTTKFLKAYLEIRTLNLPIEDGEYITAVITVKPLADVPTGPNHKLYSSPNYNYARIFETSEKIKDKYATIICCSKKEAGSTIQFFFDRYGSSDTETCETAQSFEIAEVAIFKGFHFGYCKSKMNITPEFKI